jgi:hypothetical protein
MGRSDVRRWMRGTPELLYAVRAAVHRRAAPATVDRLFLDVYGCVRRAAAQVQLYAVFAEWSAKTLQGRGFAFGLPDAKAAWDLCVS